MMIWQIITIIILLAILFLIKSNFDKIVFKERRKEYLDSEWGDPTRDEEEYSDKLLRNIGYYHEQKKTSASIDDTTWNDLNMDAVFFQMNHTRTSAGEEYLYHILRSPVYEEKELLKREVVIQSMQEYQELRNDFELTLYDIGKNDTISVYEYLSRIKEIQPIPLAGHVFAALALLVAIVAIFLGSPSVLLLLFGIMGVNGYFYYKEKAKVIQIVSLFQFILETLRQCKDIGKISLPGCEKYFMRLQILSEKFQKFSRFHFLVFSGNTMSGSIFDAVFDYVRILSHIDFIKLSFMIKETKKYERELLEIYDIIGFLDSMLAVASYRQRMEEYCIPELHMADTKEDMQHIKIKGMYHPLLKNPVKNDLETNKCMLLTGSNASGKSTFIKATAINVLFAQTIHTVLAEAYEACFYRIYSSMALRDNILSEESYFIVEIKSLKRIFSEIEESEIPVFCFIDEILRGTNTVERVAASAELLSSVSGQAMCFAATHDIELTYLLEETYANYHFAEHIQEEDILFDYLLKEGRADSKNAIRLLSVVGFDETIIRAAQKRVTSFLQEGVWR